MIFQPCNKDLTNRLKNFHLLFSLNYEWVVDILIKRNATEFCLPQKEITTMRAIQFESVIQNDTIRIPKQYNGWGASPVLVTIIPAAEAAPSFLAKTRQKPSGIDEFPALLNTKGWIFNRDEANER
jgi:hypothetical protein